MAVDTLYIRIGAVGQFLKVLPPIHQEQGSVLDQIDIGAVLCFLDLKAKDVPVETNHRRHVIDQPAKSIKSHGSLLSLGDDLAQKLQTQSDQQLADIVEREVCYSQFLLLRSE